MIVSTMPKIIPITDYSRPELDVYARLREPELLHYYEPDPGLFIAESPNVIDRALTAGYKPVSLLMEPKDIDCAAAGILEKVRKLEAAGEIPSISVYTAPLDVLTKITGFKLTRGVLAAMQRRTLPDPEHLITTVLKDISKQHFVRIAILENVVNPANVGAIFRSAAALDIDAVFLTPACSDPLYRRAARVSMGTVFQVPWTFTGSCSAQWPDPDFGLFRKFEFKTAAMALTDQSISIDHPDLLAEERLAILLGTEGEGLLPETIRQCDYTVKIPMSHGVDSLNVAAASAVAFWQLAGSVKHHTRSCI
jgi:tRNA G18 (ribose-2'-O)-methylase SpoU